MRNGSPKTRNGKFIAVANMKGGVGKTTTVVSLAEALAADDPNAQILVIDLDPQASASVAIAGDDELDLLIEEGRTFEAFLHHRLIDKARINVAEMIHPSVCATQYQNRRLAVALLPCGPKLRKVERELIYELARTESDLAASDLSIMTLLQKEVLPLAKFYDYILIDCAPGISPVTEVAIRLSDIVIVPTIPDRLSVYGLNAFYETIWMTESPSLPTPKADPSILVMRMNKSIRQHAEVFEALQVGAAESDAGYRLMTSQVPTSAALVDALMKPDSVTFLQKYTPPVVTDILKPLVTEVKAMR